MMRRGASFRWGSFFFLGITGFFFSLLGANAAEGEDRVHRLSERISLIYRFPEYDDGDHASLLLRREGQADYLIAHSLRFVSIPIDEGSSDLVLGKKPLRAANERWFVSRIRSEGKLRDILVSTEGEVVYLNVAEALESDKFIFLKSQALEGPLKPTPGTNAYLFFYYRPDVGQIIPIYVHFDQHTGQGSLTRSVLILPQSTQPQEMDLEKLRAFQLGGNASALGFLYGGQTLSHAEGYSAEGNQLSLAPQPSDTVSVTDLRHSQLVVNDEQGLAGLIHGNKFVLPPDSLAPVVKGVAGDFKLSQLKFLAWQWARRVGAPHVFDITLTSDQFLFDARQSVTCGVTFSFDISAKTIVPIGRTFLALPLSISTSTALVRSDAAPTEADQGIFQYFGNARREFYAKEPGAPVRTRGLNRLIESYQAQLRGGGVKNLLISAEEGTGKKTAFKLILEALPPEVMALTLNSQFISSATLIGMAEERLQMLEKEAEKGPVFLFIGSALGQAQMGAHSKNGTGVLMQLLQLSERNPNLTLIMADNPANVQTLMNVYSLAKTGAKLALLEPPTEEELHQILKQEMSRNGVQMKAAAEKEFLAQLLRLSSTYQRRLEEPYRSLEFLRNVLGHMKGRRLTVADLYEVAPGYFNINARLLTLQGRRAILRDFKQSVDSLFPPGDPAIEKVIQYVNRYVLGLQATPDSNFLLFTGLRGIGKSVLAKLIAQALGRKVITVNAAAFGGNLTAFFSELHRQLNVDSHVVLILEELDTASPLLRNALRLGISDGYPSQEVCTDPTQPTILTSVKIPFRDALIVGLANAGEEYLMGLYAAEGKRSPGYQAVANPALNEAQPKGYTEAGFMTSLTGRGAFEEPFVSRAEVIPFTGVSQGRFIEMATASALRYLANHPEFNLIYNEVEVREMLRILAAEAYARPPDLRAIGRKVTNRVLADVIADFLLNDGEELAPGQKPQLQLGVQAGAFTCQKALRLNPNTQ